MDIFKLKRQMQAGLERSYQSTRGVEVIGDAIEQLLNEGLTPSDVSRVLLGASSDVVMLGEPIEVFHVAAIHTHRAGDAMMRYIERVQPDVLTQFD